MRTLIITFGTLAALFLGAHMPEWMAGDHEFQQQSCKDNGTC